MHSTPQYLKKPTYPEKNERVDQPLFLVVNFDKWKKSIAVKYSRSAPSTHNNECFLDHLTE